MGNEKEKKELAGLCHKLHMSSEGGMEEVGKTARLCLSERGVEFVEKECLISWIYTGLECTRDISVEISLSITRMEYMRSWRICTIKKEDKIKSIGTH